MPPNIGYLMLHVHNLLWDVKELSINSNYKPKFAVLLSLLGTTSNSQEPYWNLSMLEIPGQLLAKHQHLQGAIAFLCWGL